MLKFKDLYDSFGVIQITIQCDRHNLKIRYPQKRVSYFLRHIPLKKGI